MHKYFIFKFNSYSYCLLSYFVINSVIIFLELKIIIYLFLARGWRGDFFYKGSFVSWGPSFPEKRKEGRRSLLYDLKPNDLRLVVDVSTSRGDWPLGVIDSAKTSNGELVRFVDVVVANDVKRQPITSLVLLETDSLHLLIINNSISFSVVMPAIKYKMQ